MQASGLSFSIAGHAAWAPGIETPEAWRAWANAPFVIDSDAEPAVRQMPAMMRRRAGFLGKMALEVAYQCLDGRSDIPAVFCSRHGEVSRAFELLNDLVQDAPLSPTGFGLAVHNASAGLFSIARADQANHLALAAGASTVEHGVIEACSLLADGAPTVLLVVYDNRLPLAFTQFEDCNEQPYAWAWLMESAGEDAINLSWSAVAEQPLSTNKDMPAGLQVLRFQLSGEQSMERVADQRCWHWMRNV